MYGIVEIYPHKFLNSALDGSGQLHTLDSLSPMKLAPMLIGKDAD
jgi:hypothetical protein